TNRAVCAKDRAGVLALRGGDHGFGFAVALPSFRLVQERERALAHATFYERFRDIATTTKPREIVRDLGQEFREIHQTRPLRGGANVTLTAPHRLVAGSLKFLAVPDALPPAVELVPGVP